MNSQFNRRDFLKTSAAGLSFAFTLAADPRTLIGEAVAMAEPTDFTEYRAGVFEALAHVEARAGRAGGWRSALDRALAERERKGNLAGAQHVRALIEKGPPEPVPRAT